MKLHDFINANIGNKVCVTGDGDFSMSSSLVGKEFILERLTKGGMAIISDEKCREYPVPPKNIKIKMEKRTKITKILKESLPFEMCIPNENAENEIDWFNKHCVVADSISDGLRKLDEQDKQLNEDN